MDLNPLLRIVSAPEGGGGGGYPLQAQKANIKGYMLNRVKIILHLKVAYLLPPVALSLMCRAVMPISLHLAATS